MKIMLDTIEKLKAFQILALRLPAKVNVTLKQGPYFTVNARTTLGILSLDQNQPMDLILYGGTEEMMGYFFPFCCDNKVNFYE